MGIEKTLTGNPALIDSGFNNPPKSPLQLLKNWLSAADKLDISEPRGFTLSTVNKENKLWSRVVLLKTIDDHGITFGGSELSRKGQDIEENKDVSGNLWWRETMQQVSFSGYIKKLSSKDSDAMFQDRTRDAQAVAVLSKQSAPISDLDMLSNKVRNLIDSDAPITRPKTWHAYYIKIDAIEFWQGSKNRFHKRLYYKFISSSWNHHFLQP